ncbi:MAG: hypothetical protein J3K34DRAFT_187545 [Monoraphidium minutum]|nr:MAG: hypothetical protein J3K34DRAFT_187545 [Monoraphidium minutum]
MTRPQPQGSPAAARAPRAPPGRRLRWTPRTPTHGCLPRGRGRRLGSREGAGMCAAGRRRSQRTPLSGFDRDLTQTAMWGFCPHSTRPRKHICPPPPPPPAVPQHVGAARAPRDNQGIRAPVPGAASLSGAQRPPPPPPPPPPRAWRRRPACWRRLCAARPRARAPRRPLCCTLSLNSKPGREPPRVPPPGGRPAPARAGPPRGRSRQPLPDPAAPPNPNPRRRNPIECEHPRPWCPPRPGRRRAGGTKGRPQAGAHTPRPHGRLLHALMRSACNHCLCRRPVAASSATVPGAAAQRRRCPHPWSIAQRR